MWADVRQRGLRCAWLAHYRAGTRRGCPSCRDAGRPPQTGTAWPCCPYRLCTPCHAELVQYRDHQPRQYTYEPTSWVDVETGALVQGRYAREITE